jgi:hypothetical protein
MSVSDDTHTIINLLNLYGVGVDSQRWELFDRIFADDVYVDCGPTTIWRDRAGFKADFATAHRPYDTTQHAMMNHLVDVDGDRANSLTYGIWRLERKSAGANSIWQGGGWYDDQWIRTAEGWRIAKRVNRITWWDGNSGVTAATADVNFTIERHHLRREVDKGEVNYLNILLGR